MRYPGLCARVPLGETFRPTLAIRNIHRRFSRWQDRGAWEKLLNVLINESDYKWLMIDASHCKVHPHAAGAKGGNQEMSRTKGAQHQNTSGRGCAWYAG